MLLRPPGQEERGRWPELFRVYSIGLGLAIHVSVGGRALDLLVALLILFLFVALGVLGRADLASLGVDACASLSFAFHDFACGFGGHM
eukprot:COSAG02_NODE_1711_length_11223_cov_5.622348_17_plen_88_part_00